MLDLRSKLAVPWFFRLFKDAIGAHSAISTFVDEHVRPQTGDRVLDIGCGLGDILEHFSGKEVDYLGLDVSEDYIDWARRRYGERARFLCRGVSRDAIDERASFDLVLSVGVIHHLNDEGALELLELARSALTPQGRLVTFDGCYVRDQARLSRFIVSRDRGHHVRTEEAYVALAERFFSRVEARIRTDLLRIPYTHIILECSG